MPTIKSGIDIWDTDNKLQNLSDMKTYTDYKEYINSKEWKEKSCNLRLLAKSCYCCGSSNNLAVHHTNYFNLGNENDFDLKVLCGKCHKKVHFSSSGNFYSSYPRTYKRVKGLRRLNIKKGNIKILGGAVI